MMVDDFITKDLSNRFADVGVEVHGIDEIHIGVFLREVFHCSDHVDEAFTEVLTAVTGDENKLLALGKTCDIVASGEKDFFLFCCKGRIILESIYDHVEGIDDGVAGDKDLALGFLLFQVLLTKRCRGEVVCGDATCYLTIHLLRPRAVDVMCAQTCFNMTDRYLLVECGEGGSGGGGGVTMYQHHIGLAFLEDITHAREHSSRDIIQVLTLLHDVEVIVGGYVEDAKHLIQHLAMLTGDAHDRLEILCIFLELLHQRSHLNGLWAGPKYEHNCFHYCTIVELFDYWRNKQEKHSSIDV